jgi:hypothetical protein
MEKIVIIGSSGSGKTTLARELGSILKMNKVIHLDRLFWQRGWKGKTRGTRIDILQCLIREKQWIIEGIYLNSSEPCLEAADTIIFLDISPLVCLHSIMKRHYMYHGRSRRDLPEGCTDKLTRLGMLKVLTFPLHGRRRLEEDLRKFPPEKVIRLHSAKEVVCFLTHLRLHVGDKRQFSKTASVVEERHLAVARR